MKRNNRFICIALVILAFCFVAGCSKKSEEKEQDNTHTYNTVTDATTEFVPVDNIATNTDEIKTDEDGFIVRNDYVKTTADIVNLRTAPDAEAPIYKLLEKDVVLNRTGDNAEWTRVIVDNTAFYVYSDYVEITEAPSDNNVNPDNVDNPDGDDGNNADTPVITTKNKIIVIDPGNQANDNFDVEPIGPDSERKKQCVTQGFTGIALGAREYDLNLTISTLLKLELESRGYHVIMTRETNDVNLSNSERAQIANESGATALVRIQMNYSQDPTVTGVMALCMTENSEFNSELYEESNKLSTRILQGLTNAMEVTNRGIYETNEITLVNWSNIPVAVVKLGFLSNVEEESKLCQDEYQKQLVKALADGLALYYEN